MKKYIMAIVNITEIIVAAASAMTSYMLFRRLMFWLSDTDCGNAKNAILILGIAWLSFLIFFDVVTAHDSRYEGVTRKKGEEVP